MSFEILVYDVDNKLFQSGGSTTRRAAKTETSPADAAEDWQKRAEEAAKNYQQLLSRYRQLKSSLKEMSEWRQRCQAVLSGTLRNCKNLEFALEAARATETDDPACQGLVQGIEQAVDSWLRQLHGQGLIEMIEPEPAGFYEENYHEVVGTVKTDELAAGLIAEVVEIGYLNGDKPIRKAKVILAAPADDNEETQEVDAHDV